MGPLQNSDNHFCIFFDFFWYREAMILHDIYERHVLRLAHERCPSRTRGRPRALGDSDALDGIFRVLRTGMQWRELGGATS